ncbi:MAG: phosphoribosyl-AMP cyclohydrolase, partial [Burkholderiaceae bacterium]|nr:phosphoribosyl-AMP cyclohydrolase [Burkholderiaceae bacterium]
VYFSRSRQQLWHKGESSGHTQIVKDVRLDCDGDVILLIVEQIGDIACHTGRQSCFYRQLKENDGTMQWQSVDPVLKDPHDIYK